MNQLGVGVVGSNYAKGVLAEQVSSKFLKKRNYSIIGQRIKYRCGEIDILAKQGNDYHIFEVKMRSSKENAMYAISSRSAKRSVHAFFQYAEENNLQYDQLYFKGMIMNKNFEPEIIDIDAFDIDMLN